MEVRLFVALTKMVNRLKEKEAEEAKHPFDFEELEFYK